MKNPNNPDPNILLEKDMNQSKTTIPNEEILFTTFSQGWQRSMPVTLITYEDESLDLHCQTGDHHVQAIEKAKEILKGRKLKVGKKEMMGPTGVYYPVTSF